MKQDRFLIGILVGIAALVVIALAVFFLRGDNLDYVPEDAPEGVVRNYAVALYKEDYQKAYGYLAEADNKPTYEQFRQSLMSNYVNPVGAGLEILDSDIEGDLAVVRVSVIYNSGDPFSSGYRGQEQASLVLQNGAWKLKQMPYNFWGYDWYQPTPQPY
jgi:hypothetical protein